MKLGSPFCKEMNIQGFTVKHDPIFTKQTGVFIAALFYDGSIFVTDDFLKLSDNAQEFVLLHELGHYANGHLNKFSFTSIGIIYTFVNYFGFVPKQEAEADDFAYKFLGRERSIKAMEETLDVLKQYSKFKLDHLDLNLRIKRLKNKN